MRPNDTDNKTRRIAKQPFVLTSQEIMADLLYPAPVRTPDRKRGRR